MTTYRRLVDEGAVTPLRDAEHRAITRYASRVLGSRQYAPWLVLYTSIRGHFCEGWITPDFLNTQALPTVNGAYRTIGGARTLTRRLVRAAQLPDRAYLVDGQWFDLDYRPIAHADIRRVLFKENERVVLKSEGGAGGASVHVLDPQGFDAFDIRAAKRLVAQAFVQQHDDLARFGSSAAATLRILSGHRNGRSEYVAAFLRVGGPGDRFVRSSTQVRILVEDGSGTLAAYCMDKAWRRYPHHPATGHRFAGTQVPSFAEAVDRCTDLHQSLPQFTLIGWDLVIDAAGIPVPIEANLQAPGVSFLEATGGPFLTSYGFERFAPTRRRALWAGGP